MSNFMRALLAAAFGVALVVLAGCASPSRMNAQWINPQFAGKPMAGKVLVMSITPDGTTRRVFEDLMVQNLQARGVSAVQSYRWLSAEGAPSEAQVDAALKESGAQSMLTTRIVSATQSIQVAPGMAPGWGWPWGWGWGWGGYYGGMWGGAYAAPQVWTEQNVVVNTQWLDAGSHSIVWSGSTTTTTAPGAQGSVPVLQQLVQVIADAMAQAKLI